MLIEHSDLYKKLNELHKQTLLVHTGRRLDRLQLSLVLDLVPPLRAVRGMTVVILTGLGDLKNNCDDVWRGRIRLPD